MWKTEKSAKECHKELVAAVKSMEFATRTS